MRSLKLQITGDLQFSIQNLKKGNEVTNTMSSGDLVIDGFATPFVLQEKVRGRLRDMTNNFRTTLAVISFEQLRKTDFTKKGYASLLLTHNRGQLWVYIKKEDLREFFTAICMSTF